MDSLEQDAEVFVSLLRAGRTAAAIEQFYDDEVVVFENRELARAGKQQCLQYENDQLAMQPRLPEFKVLGHAVNPRTGRVFIECVIRFSEPSGRPMRLEQVAVQKWAAGKIVEERFYYEGVVDEGDSLDVA